MRYLIDTDWVIHHLNGRLDISQRLQALHPEGLGLSVIVLAELYEGIYYSRDTEQSEQTETRGTDAYRQCSTRDGA